MLIEFEFIFYSQFRFTVSNWLFGFFIICLRVKTASYSFAEFKLFFFNYNILYIDTKIDELN